MLTNELKLGAGQVMELEGGSVRQVRLIKKLGEGGFAEVWKATHVETGEVYAAKVCTRLTPGTELMARARAEAEMFIPSEYIISSRGLFLTARTIPVLLFPYFQSMDLKVWMAGQLPAASWGRRRGLFLQIVQGVADAHAVNVIHRDLKPQNVLVNSEDQARIIDFGIAKFEDSKLTRSGMIMGTPMYMAPEQFLRGVKHADARADIYALGQMLYELCMGEHFWDRRKFRVKDYLNFIKEHDVAVDLDDFECPFLDHPRQLLGRMVAVSLDRRYTTMEELLVDLGRPAPTVKSVPEMEHRVPYLVVESGDMKGAMTPVALADGACLSIGRAGLAGANDLLSREHAQIQRRGNSYQLNDSGSTNGTFLRGVRLPAGLAVEINHADRIRFADTFTRFVFLDLETRERLPGAISENPARSSP